MLESNTPIYPCCFCYEYIYNILYLCDTVRFEFQGQTPYETVMNYTPDISEQASFSWLQWPWFFDKSLKINELCRWLRPDHGVCGAFFSYIKTDTGVFITQSSAIPTYEHEITTNHMKKLYNNFIKHVKAKIGNANFF